MASPKLKTLARTTADISALLRDAALSAIPATTGFLAQELKKGAQTVTKQAIDMINTSNLAEEAKHVISGTLEAGLKITKDGLGTLANTVGVGVYGYEIFEFLLNLYRVDAWNNLTASQKILVGVLAAASTGGPGYTLYNWISEQGTDNEKHILANAGANAGSIFMLAGAKDLTTFFANRSIDKINSEETILFLDKDPPKSNIKYAC